MSVTSKEVRLAAEPGHTLQCSDFEIAQVELAAPGPDEIVVRNTWMSIDPNVGLRLLGRRGEAGDLPRGTVLPGAAVGIVEQSRSPLLHEGALVRSMNGWRTHFVARADSVEAVDANVPSPSLHLGLLGMTGLTAWVGVEVVLQPQPGDTVFISSAAGAVGSIACQLARARGARVLGSAGAKDKADWLVDVLGIDAAVNYRQASIPEFLERHAPQGLAGYFDNVGGETLDAALVAMQRFGKVAVCGAIAQYQGSDYRSGPREFFSVVEKSLSITGFFWGDHRHRSQAIYADLLARLASGTLVSHEHVLQGIEQAATGLISLYGDSAGRVGKLLVRLHD